MGIVAEPRDYIKTKHISKGVFHCMRIISKERMEKKKHCEARTAGSQAAPPSPMCALPLLSGSAFFLGSTVQHEKSPPKAPELLVTSTGDQEERGWDGSPNREQLGKTLTGLVLIWSWSMFLSTVTRGGS